MTASPVIVIGGGFIGLEVALRSYFVFLAPILFFVINRAIAKEEMLLEKYFGSSYRAYKKLVPRWILSRFDAII